MSMLSDFSVVGLAVFSRDVAGPAAAVTVGPEDDDDDVEPPFPAVFADGDADCLPGLPVSSSTLAPAMRSSAS